MKLQKLYFIWICRDLQDLAWFKGELLKIEQESSIIHSTIYITGNIPISSIKEIVMDDKNSKSELQHCTFYGRPKWPKIFQSIKRNVKYTDGKAEVGVFFCGPPQLKSVLLNEIKNCSTYEIQFILRSEQF